MMIKIQQLQSKRPNKECSFKELDIRAAPIYGGLVAHTATLIKSLTNEAEQIPKPKRKTTAKEHYTAEIEAFMQNCDDFLKDKKGREVFSVAEVAEYLSLSSHHASRHCPLAYFAAQGRSNLMFRGLLKIGGANLRGIALKNTYMWHNATPIQVNAHIKKFIDKT